MTIDQSQSASLTWRAYVTDGVPASGAHNPVKSEIRTWGGEVESAIATVSLYLTNVAGTNTITADSSPEISAYSAGQIVMLVPANTITGATTININSLGAKNIYTPDGDALAGGELIAGRLYPLVYDGTQFRMLTWPVLEASATWDPGSLADGAGETKVVTVTGAALGDFVQVSFSADITDMTLSAYVQAADTVECRLQNESGSVHDQASGTVYVRVSRR